MDIDFQTSPVVNEEAVIAVCDSVSEIAECNILVCLIMIIVQRLHLLQRKQLTSEFRQILAWRKLQSSKG